MSTIPFFLAASLLFTSISTAYTPPTPSIVSCPTSIPPPQQNAPGRYTFSNRCPYDIYMQHFNGEVSGCVVKVPSRTSFSEHIQLPSAPGCGMAIKASKSETFKGNPDGEIVQFEYSIEKDSIYAKMMYDISYVDCAVGASAEGANFDKCPGHELGHSIVSPNEDACDKVQVKGGQYSPVQAYYVDTPLKKHNISEPVYGCGSAGYGMDLDFTMCSDEAPLEGAYGKKRSVAGRILLD